MNKAWELLLLIVIVGAVTQMIIEFIAPLIPYIAGGVLVGVILIIVYRRYSQW